MVEYLDDYLFRRQLLATLRPSLQKEVLHRGITVELAVCKTYWKKQRILKIPHDMTLDPECQQM